MEHPAPSSPRIPKQIIAERYELVRLLGTGGMGQVWEARHLALATPVAIKFAVERGAWNDTCAERFKREVRAMARLRSADIVQIQDAGEFEGQPFLVMELLEGESLKTMLDREHTITLDDAAQLATRLGRALSAIHSERVVHRDVTPGNVFVLAPTAESSAFRCKLLDFGIAQSTADDPRITSSGAIIGSPAYISPEQARCESLDSRSDLWAMGAVLYHAVTGQVPFAGRSVAEVLCNICSSEIPIATEANPQLPRELNAFFERAFARNLNYRFDNASQMSNGFCAIVARPAHVRLVTDAEPPLPTATEQSLPEHPARLVAPLGLQKPYRWRALAAALSLSVTCLGIGFGIGARGVRVASEPPTGSRLSLGLPSGVTPLMSVIAVPSTSGGQAQTSTLTTDTAVSAPTSTPQAPTLTKPGAGPRGLFAKLPARSRLQQHDDISVDPDFGLPVVESSYEQNPHFRDRNTSRDAAK